ncbi:MAG TPA: hypothetical protein VFB38_26545 [Chthonomonadaceae bacterium]|jgi:type II secretory pathway pseudopilin PulG|nr:hypothetical protein [Chthonomonadaceae bacterium]
MCRLVVPISADSGRAARRGFTLIEMVVITIVLILMAAYIVPNMVALTRSRSVYAVEAAIQRAPVEARNEARRSQRPVALRVEGDVLVLARLSEAGDLQEFKRIALGNTIQVTRARLGSETRDLASWQWTVYPDGSADSGGLEFSEGTAIKSLVLSQSGEGRWSEGALPDTNDDRWQAGELEQRG